MTDKWKPVSALVFPKRMHISILSFRAGFPGGNALPGISNTFISLIGESSLAFSLGLVDLFAQAKLIRFRFVSVFEAYLAVAIIFWVLVVILTLLQQRLEAYAEEYR